MSTDDGNAMLITRWRWFVLVDIASYDYLTKV